MRAHSVTAMESTFQRMYYNRGAFQTELRGHLEDVVIHLLCHDALIVKEEHLPLILLVLGRLTTLNITPSY